MVGHWQPSWVVALAASCVIHTGLVGAVIGVGPSPGRAPESDVLQADLVPPASPAPVASPLPARPPRPLPIPVPPTRLTLAKPMAAPRSDVAETPAADIPLPARG